jgi:hypothetical protein
LQRLGKPEIQHLNYSIGPQLHIGRLQIAVNNTLIVRRFQRLGDLARD